MFLVARCGGHWDDDAPVQGGMNVWVDSRAVATLAASATTGTVVAATMVCRASHFCNLLVLNRPTLSTDWQQNFI